MDASRGDATDGVQALEKTAMQPKITRQTTLFVVSGLAAGIAGSLGACTASGPDTAQEPTPAITAPNGAILSGPKPLDTAGVDRRTPSPAGFEALAMEPAVADLAMFLEAGPANPTVPSAGDAWTLNSEAAAAERPAPKLPTPAAEATGPGMAAQLYGELLGTEIPGDGIGDGFFTSNIRQITFSHEGSDFDPRVSRDGRFLVYASTQHRQTADIYIQPVGSRVITRLSEDPAQDVMPTISPDGERIAFASNRSGSWDLWVMPIDGGKAVQVTSGPDHDLHPSWSPDGRCLVYSKLGQTSGRWELWLIDVFDNARSQFIGYGLFPEWCPRGGTGADGADQILFQRSRERGDRTFSVWTMDYDKQTEQAGRQTQIASDPDFALINPAWSPEGDRITYAAVPNPDAWTGSGPGALPPSASIWMVGVDGRGEVPLTSGDSIDMMPTWSSRGQVLFVSNRSGVENLWAIDIAPAILAATGVDPSAPQRRVAEAAEPAPQAAEPDAAPAQAAAPPVPPPGRTVILAPEPQRPATEMGPFVNVPIDR